MDVQVQPLNLFIIYCATEFSHCFQEKHGIWELEPLTLYHILGYLFCPKRLRNTPETMTYT